MNFLKKYIGLFLSVLLLSSCQGVTWHIKDIGALMGGSSDKKQQDQDSEAQDEFPEQTANKEVGEDSNIKDVNTETSEVGSESITITDSNAYDNSNSGTPLNKDYQYYIVQSGDSLYSISKLFGVSIDVIKQTNNISGNVVRVGSEILIPRSKYNSDSGAFGVGGDTKSTILNPSSEKKKEQSKVVSVNNENFKPPLVGNIMNNFGSIVDGNPIQGIIYSVKKGVDVNAARSGMVVYEGDQLPALGNMIIIKHDDEWLSLYANLDSILVKKGQVVKQGQEIGVAGNTGNVKRPQLYFEVRKDKVPVDPQTLFKK